SGGAGALLVTFGWAGTPGSFPKVTRCKSGTNSRRDRSNGYVHRPKTIAVELHLEALYIQDYWHLVLR
ncbi:hypothetical protein, partial [Pseudomonas sp. VB3]|uniref:hypothetical protein n=1 Tax=Pseudomonas sp. VB3 TaxID=2994641 RepID=UPI0022EC3B08